MAVYDGVYARPVHVPGAAFGQRKVDIPILRSERIAERPMVQGEQILVDHRAKLAIEPGDSFSPEGRGRRVIDTGVNEQQGAVATSELHAVEEPRELTFWTEK